MWRRASISFVGKVVCKRITIESWYWRSDGKGHGNPLQHSCLENPMDRGAWGATGHGAAKNWTRLSDSHTHCGSVAYSFFFNLVF